MGRVHHVALWDEHCTHEQRYLNQTLVPRSPAQGSCRNLKRVQAEVSWLSQYICEVFLVVVGAE